MSTSDSGVGPPAGNGWVQLSLISASIGVGALLLFTPLAIFVVPGIVVIVLVSKLRSSSAVDQDGAKVSISSSSPPSYTSTNADGDASAAADPTQVGPVEAPPPQPVTSAAQLEDLLQVAPKPKPAAIAAAARPSAAQVAPAPAPAPPPEPTVAAAPPVQATPTRSLVPEVPSEPPKPANAADVAKAAEPPAAAAPAVAPTGGAAILARLRQKITDPPKPVPTPAAQPLPAAAAPPAPPKPKRSDVKPPVHILYGSQTGTAQEIARNLAAEAVEKGFDAKCASLNELGFAALSPARTPLLVVVTSSTGDGDPPDNAAAFFVSMRRKPPPGAAAPEAPLAGVRFTLLGLGDSNYTRFMCVPRAVRGRLTELGATEFYRSAEADEVDGVENVVDPWMEGLWGALEEAVAKVAEGGLEAEVVDEPAATVVTKDSKTAAAEKEAAEAAAAKAAAEAAAKAAAEAAAAEAAARAAAEAAAAEAAAKAAAEAAAAEAAAKAAAEAAAAETAAKAAADAAAAEAAAKAAAEAAEAEAAAKAAAEAAAAEAAALAAAEAAAAEAKAAEEAAAAASTAADESVEVAEAATVEAEQPAEDAPPAEEAAPAEAPAEEAATEAAPDAAAEVGTPQPEAPADPAPAEAAVPAAEEAAPPPQDEPAAAAPEAPPAAEAAPLEAESESLLPDALVDVMEAAAAPTAATAGLPTIAESRVFEDDEETLPPSASMPADGGSEPALTPTISASQDLRPESSASRASGSAAGSSGTRISSLAGRKSVDMAGNRRRSIEKPPSRLQAKPINVNFPKREETVVKRKDEKDYGMLMGLAPVGVDTKGAPALLPCRLKIQWEKDEAKAKGVREREAAHPTREERHQRDPAGTYSAAQPFWAHISDARYETAFWSDRKVMHLELSIRGANMEYEPGDSIGVLAVNHPDLVTNLCKRLHLNPDKVFSLAPAGAGPGAAAAAADGGRVASHIPSPCSVGYALAHCVDLTSVTRKSVLRLLAEHAVDAAEKRTLMYLSSKSPGGKEAYGHEITEHQPSILDLLTRFRSVNPPLEALLDALPPLMPRMYSISSSRKDPARGPTRLSVAMSVVRFKTRYGTRLGVATTWLDRLAAPFTADGGLLPEEPIYVPIFLRRAADFKPPSSLATPMIMVGPGTGVAPFRGFLQERRALIQEQKPAPGSVGEAVLFFGCRRDDEDYLYKEELEAFAAEGTLTALHVAFSRAQADKVYVQDLMRQQGEKVWSLVQAGAHVYVCGDGAGMAKDVHAALAEIAGKHGGLSEADATAFLQNLASERRYIRDVWS